MSDFPIVPFLSISFTHHITILTKAKEWDEHLFYIQYACDRKLNADELEATIKKDLYHHQGEMPNNFLSTIPYYKQAYRAIQMFKDEYMLDFINVEELGMRDEDIDERVVEQSIVHNIKNFIMTFGKGFTFNGSQVHYDKLGHDHPHRHRRPPDSMEAERRTHTRHTSKNGSPANTYQRYTA